MSVFHWQLLITYILFVSLKFGACYLSRVSGSEFRVKNATLFTYTFFEIFCCCFSSKICVFIIFIFFFDEVSNFCNRILTNKKPKLVIRNCQWNCINGEKPNMALKEIYRKNWIHLRCSSDSQFCHSFLYISFIFFLLWF